MKRSLYLALALLLAAGCDSGSRDPGRDAGGGGTDSGAPSRCGDGVLSPAEDCDDGNVVSGDGCAADCLAVCGDGIVQGSETCDDMNETSGDGCSGCTLPGGLVWRASGGCSGALFPGAGGTILVACYVHESLALLRYSLDGDLLESWPRDLVADDAEAELHVHYLSEANDGTMTVGLRVRRTQFANETGNARIRIMRFAPDRALVWSTDVNPYPSARPHYIRGLSVNSSGTVAAVALRGGRSSSANRVYASVLGNDGVVRWEYASAAISTATAVHIDDGGFVYVGAGHDYDLGAFVEPLIIGVSPSGTEVFHHVLDDLPFDRGGGGRIWGFEPLPSGGVLALGSVVEQMSAAGSTGHAWLRDVSADGTYSPRSLIWSTDYDLVDWDEAAEGMPTFGFASFEASSSVFGFWGVWNGGDGAFGVEVPREVAWSLERTDTSLNSFAGHQFDNLFCFLEGGDSNGVIACYGVR